MDIVGDVIRESVEKDRLERQARKEKLTSKVLTCPKCGQTKIYVYEVIKAVSQHFVDNGVWKHKYDNNEYGDGLYIDCRCDNCDHRWRSRRGINFNNYYLSEED